MEPESSSPYSQVPAICPYPDPTPWTCPIQVSKIPRTPKDFPFLLRDSSSRNTPPPVDPSVGVVYLWIVCLQRKHLALRIFLNKGFSRGGVVSTSPNPQAGGPPLVGCPRLFIQYIRSYTPYRRPFLYLQTEDAPCRGDRDPLITDLVWYNVEKCVTGSHSQITSQYGVEKMRLACWVNKERIQTHTLAKFDVYCCLIMNSVWNETFQGKSRIHNMRHQQSWRPCLKQRRPKVDDGTSAKGRNFITLGMNRKVYWILCLLERASSW